VVVATFASDQAPAQAHDGLSPVAAVLLKDKEKVVGRHLHHFKHRYPMSPRFGLNLRNVPVQDKPRVPMASTAGEARRVALVA
jgi:hypothetical protein